MTAARTDSSPPSPGSSRPQKTVDVAIAIVFSPPPSTPPSAPPSPPSPADVTIASRSARDIQANAPAIDPVPPQLLICRRKPDALLGGFWEFPGGKCEPGESPPACARREVLEETGLLVRILRPLPLIEHDYPHARVRLHPFACRQIGGNLQPLQVAEAQWIHPASVADFAFPPANAPLLQIIAQTYLSLASDPLPPPGPP